MATYDTNIEFYKESGDDEPIYILECFSLSSDKLLASADLQQIDNDGCTDYYRDMTIEEFKKFFNNNINSAPLADRKSFNLYDSNIINILNRNETFYKVRIYVYEWSEVD